jgi:uncharacterized repeat protein (TIGR03803 family)
MATTGTALICGLIFDPAGSLYGTTPVGGGPYTAGTVFKMDPQGSGGWKSTVIYRFGKNDKANGPYGGVVMDGTGHLYGVGGWAFKLSPGSGGWKETLLHGFDCRNGDGCGILDHPILDASGNLYGTTEHGGGSKNCGAGCGTVYQLQPMPDGKWNESILHRFGSPGDGAFPGVGALIIDGAGNLYGTTDIGGPNGYGTIFRLTRGSNGHWKEKILHSMTQGRDGDHVSTGVVMDVTGNLYGTTIGGGDPNCDCGVVYKLAPQTDGTWKYTVLHRFTGYDGAQPDANLIPDGKGNLYGTTITGGAGGAGVAFELIP